MPFLMQPLLFPFLCHESATTSVIHSDKVSNSQFKPVLCETINVRAPPQQPHKQHDILGHTVYLDFCISRLMIWSLLFSCAL